jgi:hypothetical protein
MYLSGNGSRNNSVCAEDRFRTDKRLVMVIFVDETLLQIEDGKDYYWLWIAYEPLI